MLHKLELRDWIILVAIVLVVGTYLILNTVKTSPLKAAQNITEACKDVGREQVSHEKCTAKEFADVGEERGLKFIGDTLNAYQSINSGYQSYQSCHVLAHRITNDLASRDNNGWKDIMEKLSRGELDPTRCGGGFMHGAIEARASEDPNFKVNAELFDEICGQPEALLYSSSCAHILGHLALVGAYGKLDEAMQGCEGLKGDFLFQCYGGIFMEDSMRTNLNDHDISDLPTKNAKWLSTQVARCSQYGNRPEVIDGCWYDLPEIFAQVHNYDLEQIYSFCSTAPTRSALERCKVRGSYLVMLVPDQMFKDFYPQTLCSGYPIKTPELSLCMRDVVGAALSGSLEFLGRAISFCDARAEASKGECFRHIIGFLVHTSITMGRKAELCAKLPEPYAGSCVSR